MLQTQNALLDVQANIGMQLEVGFVKVNGGDDNLNNPPIIPAFMIRNFQIPMPAMYLGKDGS